MKVTKRQLRRIIKEITNVPEPYDRMEWEGMLLELESGRTVLIDSAEIEAFEFWAVYEERILGEGEIIKQWDPGSEAYRVSL